MKTLYISLKRVEPDWVELRYSHRLPPTTDNSRRLKLSEIQQWIDQGTLCSHVAHPNLRRVGEKLFCWLDGDGRCLSREISQCPVSGLILAITAEERLGQLPWEVLHDGKQFLIERRGYPIFPVRWVERGTTTNRPTVKSRLQMVFMAASPQDVKPVLDFEKEEAQILEIKKTLPLSLRVEESGCVEEFSRMWWRFPENTYQIFHLTGHASFKNKKPCFITESLTGESIKVTGEELVESFRNRLPRLVFLSGCRTGEDVDGGAVNCMAETLVREGIPAVVCWGGTVLESTATLAARHLYEGLAAGYSIAESVRRSCRELWKEKKSGWHLMRLFTQAEAWEQLVSAPGDYVAEDVAVQHKFLDRTNKVRVATAEGFVGRRRLLQGCMRQLVSENCLGILLHGLGGVGKSTLAARFLERLSCYGYTDIIIYRELDVEKLQGLLASKCESKSGLDILNGSLPLRQKLTKFLSGDISPSRRLCFVLDDFEANLEARGDGSHVVVSSAVEPLMALACSIGNSGRGHRMIITSRYNVELADIDCVGILYRQPVAAFGSVELKKKCSRLRAFRESSVVEAELQRRGIEIADGNPRLLEWLDQVLLEAELEKDEILSKMEQVELRFRENILAEELLKRQSDGLVDMLSRLQIFELPVPKAAVSAVCDDINKWEEHKQRAVGLGLLEVSEFQGQMSYRVPRILAKVVGRADEIGVMKKGANALYEAWGRAGEMKCEEQLVEMYRVGQMAGDEEICIRSGSRLYELWEENGRYREALSLCGDILERRRHFDDDELWINASVLARLNTAQGYYKAAESLCEQYLELGKRLLGEEHPSVATILYSLAWVYNNQGRYEKAEDLHKQCLKMRKRLLGEEHSSVADSLYSLARVYNNQGRYREAETLHKQCLEMRKRLLGEEHLSVATSLLGLAVVYDKKRWYGEAEILHKQCLEMRKRLLGEEHPSVSSSLYGLAVVYDKQGRYGEAETLHKQCLEMRRRLLGEENPTVATSLYGLAVVYVKQRRYGEAETLHKQCLEMDKRLFGEEHPYLANSLYSVADVYHKQGQYAEAETLHKQCLKMRKRLFGEEHPSVAASLLGLARVYVKQRRYGEAVTLLKQCLEMDKRLFGEEHPYLANILYSVADVYHKQGQYAEAETLHKQCLKMRKRLLGEGHPWVASSLYGLSVVYEKQGRYVEAETLHKQCLEMRKRLLGEEHRSVAGSLCSLARVYNKQGRYGEAETLYKHCLEMDKRLRREENPYVASNLYSLANVYNNQGRYEEAKTLYKQCMEMRKRLLEKNTQM